MPANLSTFKDLADPTPASAASATPLTTKWGLLIIPKPRTPSGFPCVLFSLARTEPSPTREETRPTLLEFVTFS